jgi:hypothetical protein
VAAVPVDRLAAKWKTHSLPFISPALYRQYLFILYNYYDSYISFVSILIDLLVFYQIFLGDKTLVNSHINKRVRFQILIIIFSIIITAFFANCYRICEPYFIITHILKRKIFNQIIGLNKWLMSFTN